MPFSSLYLFGREFRKVIESVKLIEYEFLNDHYYIFDVVQNVRYIENLLADHRLLSSCVECFARLSLKMAFGLIQLQCGRQNVLFYVKFRTVG